MKSAAELNPREMLSELSQVLPGDRPDHCAQRCLCALQAPPTPSTGRHPPSSSQPCDLSVRAVACCSRTIKCHDPLFFFFFPPPGCPLRTLHPINFHSLFTGIPGLYMPTSSDLQHLHKGHKDAHKSAGDPSADAETPLEDDGNAG